MKSAYAGMVPVAVVLLACAIGWIVVMTGNVAHDIVVDGHHGVKAIDDGRQWCDARGEGDPDQPPLVFAPTADEIAAGAWANASRLDA